MRVLVTGSEGQLSRSLVERAAAHSRLSIQTTRRPDVDLARPGSLSQAIERIRPDLVINAAAYTQVDQAESEPDLAFRINRDAAGEAAAAAFKIGAPIIQLSTDYVFDGTSSTPYREDDPTNPLNVYGASKLAGEEAVAKANPDHLILRTSWVVSPFGTNFVKTMLRLATQREEVAVVFDQRGCPTSALDLADAILDLAQRRYDGERAEWGRVVHLAGSDACSRADFAIGIFSIGGPLGLPRATVNPISSSHLETAALRPSFSLLDCAAAAHDFGLRLPTWEAALPQILSALVLGKGAD